MYYVYLLRSEKNSTKTYIGYTADLKARLLSHNTGSVFYTKQFYPWKLVSYVAFEEQAKAIQFERYLKSGSGRVFAKKRFL